MCICNFVYQVKSNLEKLNTKLMTKKSKEINLDSVRSKEEKSRKRKKEDEQKKPKSNSIISVITGSFPSSLAFSHV